MASLVTTIALLRKSSRIVLLQYLPRKKQVTRLTITAPYISSAVYNVIKEFGATQKFKWLSTFYALY